MKGVYFDLKRFAIHDGPGIRTAVFFKGCPLSCPWCHNPQGIAPSPEIGKFHGRCQSCGVCAEVCERGGDLDACTRCGRCVEECAHGARTAIGREESAEELLRRILRDRPFFEQSGGGVTFTGGEPLWQGDFLEECLRLCKENDLHTALDTSGYVVNRHVLEVALDADLILFDLKLMDDTAHQKYTGVSNTTIVENLRWLDHRHREIWIRVPIVPNLTGTDENMEAIAALVSSLKNTNRVHLLPFHRMGSALNRVDRKSGMWSPPTNQQLGRAREILRRHGLDVRLRG